MTIYLIKDVRHERKEGKPSYICEGSSVTHNLYSAKRWTNKRDAVSAAKAWKKLMDYESDLWVTIEKHRFEAGVFMIA